MTSERRGFLRRGGAALLATILLAPALGPLFPSQPFHRVVTRLFLLAATAAFAWGSGPARAWPGKLRALGLSGPERAPRLARGFALGALLLLGLLLLSWGCGGRARSGGHDRPLALHLGAAALTAFLVSFFEEVLCRGYLLRVLGGAGSALVYSLLHFLRPVRGSAPLENYDPLAALRLVPSLFEPFADARVLAFGIPSLFLFGLALNGWKRRTGTLYFGIGLHAGLVFLLQLYGRWLDPNPAGSAWIFGGNRVHDGLLGTLALAILWYFSRR